MKLYMTYIAWNKYDVVDIETESHNQFVWCDVGKSFEKNML